MIKSGLKVALLSVLVSRASETLIPGRNFFMVGAHSVPDLVTGTNGFVTQEPERRFLAMGWHGPNVRVRCSKPIKPLRNENHVLGLQNHGLGVLPIHDPFEVEGISLGAVLRVAYDSHLL